MSAIRLYTICSSLLLAVVAIAATKIRHSTINTGYYYT